MTIEHHPLYLVLGFLVLPKSSKPTKSLPRYATGVDGQLSVADLRIFRISEDT